jgi:lysozyme family protein
MIYSADNIWMLSDRFVACMPFIIQEEGTRFTITRDDRGGATRYGIIQSEYDIFRHSRGMLLQSVNLISKDEYLEIYWTSYWMPHCPNLLPGLDLSFFNIAVNGGEGRAVRLLQQCLGLSIDGMWGDKTTARVKQIIALDLPSIINLFEDDELAFYKAIIAHDPTQRKFASDWFGRAERCCTLSLTMAKTPVT